MGPSGDRTIRYGIEMYTTKDAVTWGWEKHDEEFNDKSLAIWRARDVLFHGKKTATAWRITEIRIVLFEAR